MIPNKNDYLNEISKLNNEELKQTLIQLYDYLLGSVKINNPKKLVKSVLTEVFGSSIIAADINIPIKFFDTAIGTVLFSIYFGLKETTYYINDIIEMSSKMVGPKPLSKQLINYDIKGPYPMLTGTFKNRRWEFTESEVLEYLEKKGYKKI